MARLTWWEYSWDVIEPCTYFVNYVGAILCYTFYLSTKTPPGYQLVSNAVTYQDLNSGRDPGRKFWIPGWVIFRLRVPPYQKIFEFSKNAGLGQVFDPTLKTFSSRVPVFTFLTTGGGGYNTGMRCGYNTRIMCGYNTNHSNKFCAGMTAIRPSARKFSIF